MDGAGGQSLAVGADHGLRLHRQRRSRETGADGGLDEVAAIDAGGLAD